LKTPYRKVVNGKASKDIEYLSAMDEDKYYIAQASAKVDGKGVFADPRYLPSPGRLHDTASEELQYMDVSPQAGYQRVCISYSLPRA
jgi:DNA-directed RNA polymerase subunit beta